MWYPMVLTALAGYLLGNLNGAVNISMMLSHEDVRSRGSGNAGLTNFIRNFGRGHAVWVLLIDAGKTVLSCLLGGLLLQPYGFYREGLTLGALAVSLGHDFPAILGFRGGKGIVCGAAAAFVIDWRIGLALLAVFALVYGITRYVSLGSVVAAAVFILCFFLFYWGNWYLCAGGTLIGLLAIWMHRSNIHRLVRGEERKSSLFGKGKQG